MEIVLLSIETVWFAQPGNVEMHRDIHARRQIYNPMEILAIYLRETGETR